MPLLMFANNHWMLAIVVKNFKAYKQSRMQLLQSPHASFIWTPTQVNTRAQCHAQCHAHWKLPGKMHVDSAQLRSNLRAETSAFVSPRIRNNSQHLANVGIATYPHEYRSSCKHPRCQIFKLPMAGTQHLLGRDSNTSMIFVYNKDAPLPFCQRQHPSQNQQENLPRHICGQRAVPMVPQTTNMPWKVLPLIRGRIWPPRMVLSLPAACKHNKAYLLSTHSVWLHVR